MILNKIKMENFISHRNSELAFDYGINIITGPNGAGKSSILDGISFALFNTHSRGRKENLINSRASKARLIVEFREGGNSYAVEWSMERNKAAHGILFRARNGWREPLARGGERTIVPEVEKILGIDKDLFLQSIYVRQGEIEKLVTATPGVRKELISKLLGIEDLQKAWNNIKDIIGDYGNRAATIKGEIGRIPEIKKGIKESEEEVKRLKSLLKSKKDELGKVEEKIRGLEAMLEKLKEDEKNFKMLEEKRKILERDIENLEARLRDKKDELDRAVEAFEKVKALEDIVKKIPFLEEYVRILEEKEERENEKRQLEEKLKHVEELNKILEANAEKHNLYNNKNLLLGRKREERKNYEGAEEALNRANRYLKEKEREKAKKEEDLAKKLEAYSSILEEKVNIENIELILQKRRGELESKRVELKDKVEELNQKIGSLKKRRKDLEYNLSKISGAEVCPICGRKLTPDHVKKLEEEFIVEKGKIESEIVGLEEERRKANQEKDRIEDKIEKLASIDPASVKKLSDQIAEIEGEITLQKREVEDLQRRAVILKKLDEEIEKIEKEIEELEEAYQSYESAKREIARYPAREEIEMKLKEISAVLEVNISNLKDLSRSLGYEPKNPKEELKELRSKKEDYDRNEPIAKRKTELESEVTAVSKELSAKKVELNSIVGEIKRLGYDEKLHRQKEEELKKEEKHRSELEKENVKIETEIKGLNEKLSNLKEELKKLLEKEEEMKRIENFMKILDKIREAFSKDGIQKLIRARARPTIESITRNFLEEFNLEYSDVKIDDDYNITLIGPAGPQDIDQISGGERIALAIALRLAIARVLSGRIETIIMDEPTTHLDEERRKELINILNSFFRKGGRTIPQMLIITHHREIEDVADVIYRVNKKGGYSIVETILPHNQKSRT
jgi:exonuclease SbcC